MQLIKFFVVFVTLIGRTCLAKMMIEINKPNGFAELEEAVIKTLTTCYANQDKTIVLIGDYPGNFIKRLSSHQAFSLVLLDDSRKSRKKWIAHNIDLNRMHKTHIVVIIASDCIRFANSLLPYWVSGYNNPMAFFLALVWSPINKYAGCDEQWQTFNTLFIFNKFNNLNVNLMCRARTKGTMIYSSNNFTNQAPEPWRLIGSVVVHGLHMISCFEREYREHEGMCKNLHFDTTHDLGGSVIVLLHEPFGENNSILIKVNEAKRLLKDSETINLKKSQFIGKWVNLEGEIHISLFSYFITYVRASRKDEWEDVSNLPNTYTENRLQTRPRVMGERRYVSHMHAYPYKTECKFLITQYRGNKSQLKKIYDVIDIYSWYGMYMVYFITLMFFKYFLRQSLIEGILNLCRLTCNLGLTTLPPNAASQIYLACLLFFVVTMQGIFVGNLAALLTYDIPIRQVNSIKDLAELGYTVYADKSDFVLFKDPVFKGRLREKLYNIGCIPHVIRDPSSACLTWGSVSIDVALESSLHLGTDCIKKQYVTIALPWNWPLKDRFNNFLGSMAAAGTMGTFSTIVWQIRSHEEESEEKLVEPKIMTLTNLGFAFVILGVGLLCAFISFIVELMIYRYHRRVTTTQITVLN